MAKISFTVGEAINIGWEVFKKNWKFLIIFFAVIYVVSLVPRWLMKVTNGNFPATSLLIMIAIIVLGCLFEIGTIIVSLKLLDKKKPHFYDLIKHYSFFINFLLGALLYLLVFIGGLILLIIPGIIWGIKYQYTTYLIVDKKMGPIEAFKESGKLTKGYKWELFSIGIIFAILEIIGSITIIGVLITRPISRIANAYIYRKISAKV